MVLVSAQMTTVEKLRRWARARDRRNPFGHGKTGTALLREAADRITELETAVTLAGSALDLHKEWCGYRRDAPGNGSYNRARQAIDRALGISSANSQETLMREAVAAATDSGRSFDAPGGEQQGKANSQGQPES